ncbi:MAG: glycosyltransferase family 39 protein [Thermomicrobiales bacterium]
MPRAPRWWQRPATIRAIIAVALFVGAFITYYSGDATTNFHPDESRWLNRAHYIEDVLDPFGPTWNDQYLTRGQPPVGSYMMGIGLLLQGRDLDTNLAWDFRRTNQFNIDNGMYPVHGDLLAGRRTNNVIGALAVVMVFLIVTQLSNMVGGIAASLLLMANPLQSWHNRLALADTTLTLTLALIFFCSILLFRRPSWFMAIVIGILIGIGGANKLTPLSLCAPVMVIGVFMLIRSWRAGRKLQRASLAGWRDLPPFDHLGWMLSAIPFVAGATFVLVYPYLWPDPIGRTLKLLDFRTAEMANQGVINPGLKVSGPIQAIDRTWTFLGNRWSGTQEFLRTVGLPGLGHALSQLDVWLAMIGLLILAYLAFRKGIQSPHFIVLILILTETATIIVTMKTDFERYYLPIVLGFVVASGVAIGFVVDKIVTRVQRRRAHSIV